MPMPFSILADTFEKLERVTARTQMLLYLVELFKKTPPDVVDKVVYFLQGKLWPDWKGLPELGVGEKLLIKAASIALHVSEPQLEQLAKKLGDIGRAIEKVKAEKAKKTQAVGLLAFMKAPGGQQTGLTVEKVYDTLAKIAMAQGEGSREIKLKLLAGLLAEASPKEAKYIARFVEGKLRLGVGDATIMDALAAVYAGSASMRSIVERAYNLRADLGMIAKILATKGIEELKHVKPEVGIPVRPMLAERLNDPAEILRKLGGRALVEYKYDGERAQIHKKGEKIWIFSRRLENITYMYPDVVEMARKGIKASEAIVEGEIVAIDPETGELRPFQVLMHRRRKHDIHVVLSEIPVAVFLFDTIYVDGEDLTVKPLPARHEILEKIIEPSDTWQLAKGIVTSSPEELEKFFLEAIENGAEGVMAKAMHERSIYQAGSRGWLWIKYKRDYKSEMSDTVDLVVIGAFYGKGRRGGKFGALLMAAYDPDTDTFKSVCKVGSGFTDEDLDKLGDILKPYIRDRKPARVDSQLKPDVWVEPALVAEIIGAELTLSPIHTCCYGWVRKGAGISIRFPRFIRWRPDKGPEDATTAKELYEMYKRQLRKIEASSAQGY
ncbi:ATP-dependent DNA ligase [Pyrodictium occultum]|uniref:DNA ligase n=1 Tax=Pyrodictium occultum TaxID=2309 RepID=A0A0V8RTB1_PYROC|nr:DNA ligase [Pyrodictium occultum]KSW11313.1 ATP-dependent DNA ligase [Pyrodictium occultum]